MFKHHTRPTLAHGNSCLRIAIPRSAASALVARCYSAGPSPRSAAATYGLPQGFAELVWVPR
eukprot:3383612-Prymnesium_polylepis.1